TPLSSSPLCGNAVWVAGGQLKARRGNSIEVVATLNDSAGLVNVLHGGRRVDVYADLGGKRSFLFDPSTGGWAAAPNPYALPDTLPGGTFIGALWASHDGDSTVSVVPAPSGIPGAFEVRLRTGGVITKTWTVSAALANTTHWEVTRRDWWASDSSYHDTDSAQAGTIQTASARPAFSPEGRRLLVALNREQHQLTVSPTWTVCPGSVGSNPPSNCRTQQTATSTLPNEVWEIPLPPGSPHPLGTSGGTHIFWLGEAEDGGRLVSGTGVHQASATVTPLPGGGWQTTITSDQWLTCTVEFRQTASLAFLNSELSAEACSPFEAAGSFAPLRAGGAGPGTVPRPPRRGRR
ncbi:MAG: hypothetical protein OEW17_10720, partial [Gemmatimonadota bacterium]|nr:hypothetical protein [Gemmatimonadota bacterium]